MRGGERALGYFVFMFRTIDPGDYTVRGSTVLLSDSSILWPFDGMCRVTGNAAAFAVDCMFDQDGPQGMPRANCIFHLLVRPTAQNGVGFSYRDQWLPQVRGTGAWVKDAYLLSGRCTRSRANVVCHVRPLVDTVEVRALADFPGRPKATVHFTLRRRVNLVAVTKALSVPRERTQANVMHDAHRKSRHA